MSLFLILPLTVLLFLLLEGFLSGAEMAMVAADRKKLARFAHSGPLAARLTFRILQNPSWFLSTALMGSNLAEVANAALVTALFVSHFGAQGDFWAFLLLTPLILIFGEILPKGGAVNADHTPALIGEVMHCGATDAARRAGDQDYF